MEDELIKIAQPAIEDYSRQIKQNKESDWSGIANAIACALEVDGNRQFKGGSIADTMMWRIQHYISKELRKEFNVSEEDYKANLEEIRKLAEDLFSLK